MGTSVERVWARMKRFAAEYAAEGIQTNYEHALAVITAFMRAERVDPWPTNDVLEFYAREMLALIEEIKDTEAKSA